MPHSQMEWDKWEHGVNTGTVPSEQIQNSPILSLNFLPDV